MKIQKLIVLIISLLFVGIKSNFAEPLDEHAWELGTEISYINYEEPNVMEEEGMMYGISGSYTYGIRDRLDLRAEGKWSWGQVDYDGQLSNGTPYTISDIKDHMFEFRGLIGFDFPVSDKATITPYGGFGYRYLNDDPSFDPAGYGRESNYFYGPIGVKAITDIGNEWYVGAALEFDIFFGGVQRSHLSDVNSSLNDIENDQNDGFGARASIVVRKESDKIDFLIEPFVKYWDIEESELTPIVYAGSIIGFGYEPENNSLEYGIKVAVRF